MGVMKQLGLLLKQNLIERKRRWGITLLEIGWPIVLFIIVVVVRDMYTVQDVGECKYAPRAMPSSGLFPFMQSYVCNLNSKPTCTDGSPTEQSRRRTSSLAQIETTLLGSGDLFTNLAVTLEESAPALERLSLVLSENPEIEDFLNLTGNLRTRDLFKDVNGLKTRLIKGFGLNEELVDSIMDSKINITKGAEILVDIDGALCDAASLTSPLTKYLVLPRNSTVSLDSINKAICNLDQNEIVGLVDILQEELDVTRVMSLVKKAMSILTPDASDVVSDIETMIQIIGKLSSFQGLAKELPNLEKGLKFAMEMLGFIRKVTKSMPISPELIGQLLNQLDPLITQLSNNSQVWQDIRRGVFYLNKAVKWVSHTLERLPDMKISFGSLYTDGGDTILNLLNTTLSDSNYFMGIIGRSSINLAKMLEWQSSAFNPPQLGNDTLCRMARSFFDIYNYPSDVDQARLDDIINKTVAIYCDLDVEQFVAELSAKTNFQALFDEFTQYSNSTVGEQPLDWKSIIETGWELVDIVTRLQEYFEKYATLLDQLIKIDINKLYWTFQKPFSGIYNGQSGMEVQAAIFKSIADGLDFVESILKSTPAWSYVRRQLIYQNLFTELVNDAFNLSLEATNITDQYFSQNRTEQFVIEFVKLNPAVQQAVVQGLTAPKNVKTMLRNPALFGSVLCSNMTGMLDLYVDSMTEQKLDELFCQGSFEMPPGLSDKIKAVGVQIQTKVDMLVGAFNDPDALVSTSYDSVARLSQQINLNMDLNKMMAAASSEISLFKSPALGVAMKMADWEKYANVVPYSILATIMDVLGNSLEDSTGWSTMAPYVASIDHTIKHLVAVIDKQNALLTNERMIGRILDWILKYGPEKFSLTLQAMRDPEKMGAVVQLLTGGDPLSIVQLDCNTTLMDWFYGPGALNSLHIEELQVNICLPDMPQIIYAEIMDIYDITNLVSIIRNTLSSSSQDVSIDWIQMSKTLTDLPETVMDSSQLYVSHFQKYNWQAWSDFLNETLTSLMSPTNSGQLASMLPSLMRQMEAMFGNTTEWRIAKHALNIADVLMAKLADRYSDIAANGLRLSDLFENSTKIREYIIQNNKVSPVIADIFFDTAIDPTKLLSELFTANFTGRVFCQDLFVSQFVEFKNQMEADMVEKMLCGMDWHGLLAELQTDKVTVAVQAAIIPLVEGLTYNNLTDVTVDYQSLTIHTNEMIQAMMSLQNFTGPILPSIAGSFNMTVNNLRYQAALERFIDKDPSYWPGVLDRVSKLLEDKSQLNNIGLTMRQIWQQVSIQVQQNLYNTRMALQQLRAMSNAARAANGFFSLKDFVLPGELRNVLEALDNAPEMTDTLLYSLIQLSNNPHKLIASELKPELLDALCTNTTVFDYFFSLPPESNYSLALMQTSMCSFRINVTVLLHEMAQDIDGFSQYLKLFQTNKIVLIDDLFTQTFNATMDYISAIEELTTPDSNNKTLQFTPPRWMNENLWREFASRMQNYTLANSQRMNSAQGYLGIVYGLTPMVDQYINGADNETRHAFAASDAVLEYLVSSLETYKANNYNDTQFLSGLSELTNLYNLYRQLPDFVESIVVTALTDSAKIESLVNLIINQPGYSPPEVFCSLTEAHYSQYLVKPPGNKGDFSHIQQIFCTQSSIEGLLGDLKVLTAGNSSYFNNLVLALNESLVPPTFHSSKFVSSTLRLYTLIEEMVRHYNNNPENLNHMFQVTVWTRVVQNIDSEIRRMASQQFDVNMLLAMTRYIDLNALAPEVVPYIHTAHAIAKVTLRKLQPLNQSVIDIMDFTRGYPETTKAMQLFNLSTDVVELLMSSGTSVKLRALTLLPADEVLPTLCTDDWTDYFDLGPNPVVDLDGVKSYICSTVNWTVVYHELITDLDIPYIESQLTNNSTIDWVDVFSTVNATMELVQDVAALSPSVKMYPWMNVTQWDVMMQRVGMRLAAQSSSFEFQMQSMLASLIQLSPMMEQLLANQTAQTKRGVYTASIYLQEVTNVIGKLLKANWNLSALVSADTEISQLLSLLDQLPGYIDIVLQTSLEPEVIAPLARQLIGAGNNSKAVFCGITDLTQYVVYDNKTDLLLLQDAICTDMIDFEALLSELVNLTNLGHSLNVSDEYIGSQTVVKDIILSVSELTTQLSSMFSGDLSGFQQHLPHWVQPTVWTNVFNKFSQSLSTVGEFDITRLMNIIQLMGVDQLMSTVNLPELHFANSIMDVIIRKLELFNRTEVNISSIFENSPESVNALDILVHLSDIVEIMIASGNTPKFSALFSMGDPETALTALCTSHADAYLSVPYGSTHIDLDKIMIQFCKTNWTAVAKELMSDVDVGSITAQLNNTAPVDLSQTMSRVGRINELIQYLIANPPQFIADSRWTWVNATAWEGVLLRLNSYQQMDLVEMISGYFFGVLKPMFGNNPEFNKAGVVLENMLASLKSELSLWNRPGQNVTVGEILANNSALGQYIANALELTPHWYGLFMSVSIRNPGDLQLLYSSPNPQALLCNQNSKFMDNIDIPAEVNITQVKEFICSANFTVLLEEIKERFNIPEIIAAIQSNITAPANWSKIQSDLSEVVSIIQQLITNSPNVIPPFDVNELSTIASNIMNGMDWTNAEIYLKMTESMMRYMRTQPFWPEVQPYFQISQIVHRWANDVFSRLNVYPDMSINIADLFPNATLLTDYLRASLALDDDTVMKMITGVTVKPSKLAALFQPTTDNSSAVVTLVCDPTMFAEFFSVPADMSVNDLSRALCSMMSDYGAEFVSQLEKSFKVDTLIQKINEALSNRSSEVFSVRQMYGLQLDLMKKIDSLANATGVLYGNVNLREKFAMLTNETTFQSYLYALTQSLPAFELQLIGDNLNSMMPALRSMNWWNEAEKYFRMMNVMAEVGANRTAQLPAVNVTLDTLLRDSDTVKKLLKDSFAFTPDLIQALLGAELTISPMELIKVNSTSDLQDLICSAKFPAGVNVTAVKIILCDTNFQVVLDEFLSEMDFDIVIQELGMLTAYSNVSSDFDWNDLLSNTNDLARNLGVFFTSFRPPPVSEFFLYDGNMTAWFERLNNAFASTMGQEAALRRLASTLSGLESSFSGHPEYRRVIVVSQIIQNYLDLAISELNKYTTEVSLNTILRNNTGLIAVINASFRATPQLLEMFMTQPMSGSQLAQMLSNPNTDPCTMDLSTLFVTATSADVEDLRALICSMNFTNLIDELKKEVNMTFLLPLQNVDRNATSVDWAGYMDRFSSLSKMIERMVKSPPSISSDLLLLVNVTEYMQLFDRVQKYWMSQQFALNPNSFSAMMSSLAPLLSSSEAGQQLSKFINVANIIMSRLNSKLTNIKDNDVSLNTLLGGATELRDYLDTVISLPPETVATLMLSQLSGNALVLLFTNRSSELCSLDAADILVLPEGGNADLDEIKRIICDANVTVFLQELKAEFDISEIIRTLQSNGTESIQWDRLFNNTQQLSSIITYLASNDPVIDQKLVEAFNMSRYIPVWESLKEYDPRSLLKLFDIYGPLIREAAGEQWPIIQQLIYQYSTSISKSQKLLADLVKSGFTFESLMNNRTALVEFFGRMSDMSMDLMDNSYINMYRGQLTTLLQRDEIQELVCNDTALRVLQPTLPVYVDLKAVLCGVRDDSWIDNMLARNYSILEAASFITSVDRWYFDELLDGKYNASYIFSYKRQPNTASNITLGDLEEPIRELIDVLGNLGSIPPQFLSEFNMSYWRPMISALTESYAQKLPEQVLRTLESLDPLLRNTEFWQQMRNSLGAVTQYMSWINDKLEQLDSQGKTISILKLFPDIDDVRSLLESAVSPESASEFLTLAFHPAKLVLALQSDPSTLLCDPAKFNETFQFTPGVDVTTIQTDLCQASQNASLIMQRVWDMFDMKKLVEELASLTGGTKGPLIESPYRSMLKQIQRFLRNANVITRLVQTFNRDMPDIASYLNMVLTTVNSMVDPNANNIGGMCDALVNLVDEVPEYLQARPYLVRIQKINSITAQLATSLDELDDFLCDLPAMNLSTLLLDIANSDLMEIPTVISRIVKDPTYLENEPFKCSDMVRDAMLPQIKIQNMITDAIKGSFDVCIRKLTTENITMLNDINSYIGILGGLRDLLTSDAIAGLKWLDPIRPLLTEVLTGLLSQVQGSRIESLFNQTAIDHLLDAIFNQPSSQVPIKDFLGSFVDVDRLLSLMNMTIPDAEQLVCNSSYLDTLFIGGAVDTVKLSQTLCADPDKLSRLLQGMADNMNTLRINQLAATKNIEDFVAKMIHYIEALINQLKNVAKLPGLIEKLTKLDLSALKKLLPEIEKLLSSGDSLDIVFDSMIGILELLETRIPRLANNTAAANIFNDMKLLLNGIRGLKTLRNSLMLDIPLKSILGNASGLEKFLRTNSSLTDEEVTDLINSNFTSSLLSSNALSVLEIQEELCDPTRIKNLLTLPKSSKLTYEEVSKMICEIEPTVAAEISLVLVKNMNISDMIAAFISQRYNLDSAELRKAAEMIAPLQEELELTLKDLTGAIANLNISSLNLPTPAPPTYTKNGTYINKPAAVSAQSLTGLFCGKALSGYEEEATALGGIDLGSSDDADVERFAGPNNASDQCDSIRRGIFNQQGGKILWTFVKPLFVGKILYSPNNSVTRELVKNVNTTFDNLARVLQTVRTVIESQRMLKRRFNGSDSLTKLQQTMSSLKNVPPSLIKLLMNTNLDVKSLAQQLEPFTSAENQAVIAALNGVSQYADCIGLDRFVGVESEEELENVATRLNKRGEFIAGLVFMNVEEKSKRRKRAVDIGMPKHIQYKIRMDIDNVEQTQLLQDLYYTAAPRDNLIEDMRYMRGFIQIQEMVDRAIIKLHGGDNSLTQTATLLQQMPATCYKSDVFMGFVYPYIVPIIMTLSWLFAVAHCIKTLTEYRESGLEELMKIMGLRGGVIWWSWFINTFGGMTLLSGLAMIFIIVGRILILSNGFIVFLYLLTFSLSTTMFCYMVGSFFTKANVASAIGVMAFMISYLPYIIYTQFREDYTASHFHASSLLSTTAFAIGATYISRWEQMGVGVQWSNINEPPGYNKDGELSVQWMFGWMLIDSLIYFIIGWYIRNVVPGKFGNTLPLYFPFTKSYWSFGCGSTPRSQSKYKYAKSSGGSETVSSGSSATLSTKSLYKPGDWLSKTSLSDSRVLKKASWLGGAGSEYTDQPVGISINKLRKVYKNGKVAVDDLDMTFLEGQVTAFLGKNGAGKTSTINMLTGMASPTAGSAEVNGWSVNGTGITNIRQNLGFCPQFDMLFEFMTVKEHLDLFASLKSNEPATVVKYDVEDMMHNIGLWSVRDELVGNLSGGMQRRLSVAMAFIGNSKVIILDEPTSSIDPHGRRVIWDVILKYRAGRTIILCTHHLDEADTLGDRVAILDKGRLRAEGAPMSLKKQHASGYQLFLEKEHSSQGNDCDVERVTLFIKEHCPDAVLMTNIGSSLTYTLPTSELPRFDKLFTALSESLNVLRIASFGVSDSTLYEVFEKITEGNPSSSSHQPETSAKSSRAPGRNSTDDFGKSTPVGFCSVLSALFRKRFFHTVKDVKTYLALILLPCLFVALALGVTRLVPDRTDQPRLELQTSLYPNTYSFYSLGDGSADIADLSSTMLNYPGLGTVCLDPRSESDQFSCMADQSQISTASATLDPLPTCGCGTKPNDECGADPKLDSYITNTSDILIHVNEGYDIQDYLLTTDSFYRTDRYGGWTFDNSDKNQTIATVWYDNRAFHSSPSYMSALSNMLLRAAMSRAGLTASEYGITVYNEPLILSSGQLSVKNALEKTADLGISITFLTAFSFIPAGLCVYLVLEHIRGEKHLQYVSGVGPLRYWLVTYLWDILMFLIPVGLSLLLVYIFQVRSFSAGDNLTAMFLLFITYGWAILPFMYMTVKAFKNTTTAFFTLLMMNLFVGIALSVVIFLMNFFQLSEDIKESYYIMKKVFLIFPQYSFTSALIQLSLNQAFVDILTRFDENIADSYHPFDENNGIFWNLISLVIQGVVFFTITLLTELKTTTCSDRISPRKRQQDELDGDVFDEKKRVLSQGQRDALVVRGLSKQYTLHNLRHVLAVKDLTFGVKPGEIFGLCGVNGAGKTSTFKMLTGELLPSDGSATLHGVEITRSKSRRLIGYCPQINSLDVLLTGRQVLDVYAQLKGIQDPDQAITNIAASFGMQNYIDKQVKSLSGGMKRNLCVSIALLGNPDLVFLDEPSAGMDPVARRTVWNQILSSAAGGCAVVLTSHSMMECEALCTRMAIMLNGKLACLGSSQHLKNKFGLGYTLKVKVAGPLPHTNRMIAFIKSKWPRAVVKDQHLSTTEFSIPQTGSHTLASFFSQIEKERDNLYIEEYSVFQTTLDQVFIQFARNQQDQIDSSSSSEDVSSDDTESTYRYVENGAFSLAPDAIVLTEDEKTNKALQSLDGEHTWNTKL